MKTHYEQFSIKKKKKRKSPLLILNLYPDVFSQGTQERNRDSRGKRAVSVRATEVLLYMVKIPLAFVHNVLLNGSQSHFIPLKTMETLKNAPKCHKIILEHLAFNVFPVY